MPIVFEPIITLNIYPYIRTFGCTALEHAINPRTFHLRVNIHPYIRTSECIVLKHAICLRIYPYVLVYIHMYVHLDIQSWNMLLYLYGRFQDVLEPA